MLKSFRKPSNIIHSICFGRCNSLIFGPPKKAKPFFSEFINTKGTFSQDLASYLGTTKRRWNFNNHIRGSKPTSVETPCLKDLIVDNNAIPNHLRFQISQNILVYLLKYMNVPSKMNPNESDGCHPMF